VVAVSLVVRDADTGSTFWTAASPTRARDLAWSADGRRLLVVTATAALIYDPAGRRVATVSTSGLTIRDAAFSPDGRSLALVRGGAVDDLVVANVASSHPQVQRMLSGAGLRQLAWSPDGHWLLVSWPRADQWVFVRVTGKPRIAAVSRIDRQFAPGAQAHGFPTLEGWCCPTRGAAG
jgi:dipeptidyl aminopeptidase/acylaminoacyl peptidase